MPDADRSPAALPFILASASPRRRALLAALGIAFEVMKPDIDETVLPGEAPDDYVRRLSQDKAAAVARAHPPPACILAADTSVVLDGEILGKPATPDEAWAMLARLRGRMHTVTSAITLLHHAHADDAPRMAERARTQVVHTQVHLRAYSDAEIEAYIATGDPFDKAGGYAIQHRGFAPVARIEGSESNVIGLPLEALIELLDAWHIPHRPLPAHVLDQS
jgi:septum formation protein